MNKVRALELSTGLAALVTGMEDELLQNISAYLLGGKIESDVAKWKIRKLAELGKLNQKNIETIKSYIPEEKELAELTLKRAAVDAFAHAESGFRKLAIAGLVKDAGEGSMERTMNRVLKTLGKQAKDELNIVNTTMLGKAKQMANTAVQKAARLAEDQVFLDALNKAAGKTVTGTEGLTAACSKCLKEMAQKGIPAFVDKAGREWSPEAYVNVCVRSTVGNTAHTALFERMKDYGTRIIEVDSHFGARPKCAKDQGKLYDLDNGSGTVEDLHGNQIRYYPFNSTSYGQPDGLFGINCRHHGYPFTAGLSTQTYFPYDEEENAAQYKKIQKQRELERKVRASKRECAMLKDGDPQEFQKSAVKLKRQSQELKDYCERTGLTYQNERTSVLGYSHSEASRVTAAYRRALKEEEKQLKFYDKEEILKGKNIINAVKSDKTIDEAEVLKRAEEDLSVIPLEHKNIIEKSLKSVIITDDCSAYSNEYHCLLINRDMEEGNMVHEAGHIIFHELGLEKDEKYQKILRKGIENVTNYDIIYNDHYEHDFYQLVYEGKKFINEYQARVYIKMNTFDYGAKFDYSLLREYFSEGYRAYFKEPALLKETDPDLFEYIRGLIDDT